MSRQEHDLAPVLDLALSPSPLVVDNLAPALLQAPATPLRAEMGAMPEADALKRRLLTWEADFVEAKAEATVRAVRADWGVIAQWCERAKRTLLPLATDDLVLFLTDMMKLGKKRSTLTRYVSTITLIHGAAGLPSPTFHPRWPLRWNGLCRKLVKAGKSVPKQAEPLRRNDIESILANLGESALDLRDAALLSLAANTLCRESELVALRLGDIQHTHDRSGWLVEVRESKTDQDGEGDYRFCSLQTKARLDAWCHRAEIVHPEAFLFVPVGPNAAGPIRDRPLQPAQVARILARRARQAGLEVSFTGHSARVGSAIALSEDGASTEEIMRSGGWNSIRMVQRYTKKTRAGRNAMATMTRKHPSGV
ncbi:tyrosine-type recombinase/integrase (plasmid) [Xanthomonas citri pv. citri]|uniref:tyrosine-type recombinase/integrase n=1 Tax=Xanthomonas citri TaxID=346 RepID=UPI0019344E65|nr:tyrosine-type recombinase/integrase [Xanthomonas citri]QRD62616.1 tyrosine-type recombinase/integrase [Xanthomonas citri pv. citri]QRD67150.1 tyrosine-type recombinase/integrase [Xanthomonas citri pv. citri]QRD71804.1 tyrosine-type recombinase/integrase [Xanthomonas citri pv. citri]